MYSWVYAYDNKIFLQGYLCVRFEPVMQSLLSNI